jgi:RNA polymerase sigma-70 factor (ECF subfamily)
MQPTDEALVMTYLEEGDEQAFRRLVERHQDRIFGYLMGMVKDRAAANDLFQETFERVIKAMRGQRGSYDPQGQWLSWVMSIARNAAIDHSRRTTGVRSGTH